jgi:hypothetical protein
MVMSGYQYHDAGIQARYIRWRLPPPQNVQGLGDHVSQVVVWNHRPQSDNQGHLGGPTVELIGHQSPKAQLSIPLLPHLIGQPK